MSTPIDCPICMDCIESTTVNCVTTECGHCFHTNCLMQSVAHNGFGCPYCRAVMAEEPEGDQEESIWTDEEEEDYEHEDALRGFRFFWNNLYGETHDEDDEEEEDLYEEDIYESELRIHSTTQNQSRAIPSTDYVAQKLREQGVTFEQLVQKICNMEYMEYARDEEAERMSGQIFENISRIVDTYTPEQPAPVVIETQPSTRVSLEPLAQPKVSFLRRLEYC